MADVGEKAAKQLQNITECPICMSDFTDPRILPCIHTFCIECLKRTGEDAHKKPGDKMPCPLCRKEFIIPVEGMNGLQKNFFMESLLEFKTTLKIGNDVIIFCDTCSVRNEGKTCEIPKATMRCLECQDNYCDGCVKVHQYQKLSRNHKFARIGSDSIEMMRTFTTIYCTKHTQKSLDYYCADCKKIVCVSCFVESHAGHKCKDVNTVDEEFRKTIQKNSSKVSIFADEKLFLRRNAETRKVQFLKEIVDTESVIHRRNQELKDIIDKLTKSLLHELSVIKSNHLKQIEIEMEEYDRGCTILKSFEAYCSEVILKGSASDICSSVDQLIARADDLERDHEAIIGRPYKSVEVSFQTTDLLSALQKSSNKNVVGEIKETTSQLENCAIVVGLKYDGITITKDVIKINLQRPNEISTLEEIPTKMQIEAFATVYCNNMYVIGVGVNKDEIWKYSFASGWVKCASLVQGRRRHSAAFIDEVLYICGGFVDSSESVLDSVEAYNAITDKCVVVEKLVHAVESSGNCVPFKGSLYIFGGTGKDNNDLNCVQMYNTKTNTCSVLSNPMPRACKSMRAVFWETIVILLGRQTCFIFNFETETWRERKQFKTDVDHFGLHLENERVFVIGGGNYENDEDGIDIWKCRDDVRYVPLQHIINDKPVEWKIHGKLPKPTLVHAYAKMHILT